MLEDLEELKKVSSQNLRFCLIYKIILRGLKKQSKYTHIKIKQFTYSIYSKKSQFLSW